MGAKTTELEALVDNAPENVMAVVDTSATATKKIQQTNVFTTQTGNQAKLVSAQVLTSALTASEGTPLTIWQDIAIEDGGLYIFETVVWGQTSHGNFQLWVGRNGGLDGSWISMSSYCLSGSSLVLPNRTSAELSEVGLSLVQFDASGLVTMGRVSGSISPAEDSDLNMEIWAQVPPDPADTLTVVAGSYLIVKQLV